MTWNIVYGQISLDTPVTTLQGAFILLPGLAGAVISINTLALGYSGQISVSGNQLSNGTSTGILMGANMSGMENSPAQGLPDWSDDGGAPNWVTYATWNPNVVRIPLNALSFLGLAGATTASQAVTFTSVPGINSTGGTLNAVWPLASGTYPICFAGNTAPYLTGTFTNGQVAVTWPAVAQAFPSASATAVTWGALRNADPNGTYRASIKTAIDAARAIGCYVVLDLHWCAPQLTIGGVTNYLMPLGQSAMADASTAVQFWQAVVNWLIATYTATGFKDIVFELYNEPFLNSNGYTLTTTQGGATPVTADVALLNGGWSSALINNTQGGSNFVLGMSWQIAGYQSMLNAIRALGANNVCIVNGNSYAQQLQNYTTWKPTDAAGQVAFGWHSYPAGTYPYSNGNVYPKIGNDTGGNSASAVQWANAILTAGYPVICTEDGGHGGTGATSGEPHLAYMNSWADTNLASRIIWQWNSTRTNGTVSTDNFATVYAVDGTTVLPIAGEGQVLHDWMVAHQDSAVAGLVTTPGQPYGINTAKTSVRMKWAPSVSTNRIQSYAIWYRTSDIGSGAGTWTIGPPAGVAENAGTLVGLVASTKYDVKVMCTDERGRASAFSPVASFTTQAVGYGGSEYPEMPRQLVNAAYTLPVGGTKWVTSSTGNTAGTAGPTGKLSVNCGLIYALAQCQDNDVITIPHGVTWSPQDAGTSNGFVLRNRGAGTGWVYVVSDALPEFGGALPLPCTRVGPSDAANMPWITGDVASQGAFAPALGASRWRLVGLRLENRNQTGGSTGLVYGASGGTTSTQINGFVIDRCLIRGSVGAGCRHGVLIDAMNCAMIDCYVDRCYYNGTDSQTFASINGIGPFKLQNNYLDGLTEGIIFGGDIITNLNQNPLDIVVTRCNFVKDLSLRTQYRYGCKNVFEFKAGNRIYIAKCQNANSWDNGQQNAVSFKSTDQATSDVTGTIFQPSGSALPQIGDTSCTLTAPFSNGNFNPSATTASILWADGTRTIYCVTYNSGSTAVSWTSAPLTTAPGSAAFTISMSPWASVVDIFMAGCTFLNCSDGVHYNGKNSAASITPTSRACVVDCLFEVNGLGGSNTIVGVTPANPLIITSGRDVQMHNYDGTASAASGTMTITVSSGGAVSVGDYIFGTGVPAGTYITAFLTGTGKTGTYTVSGSASWALTAIWTSHGTAVFEGLVGNAALQALNDDGATTYVVAARGGTTGAWTYAVYDKNNAPVDGTSMTWSGTGSPLYSSVSNARPLQLEGLTPSAIYEHNTTVAFHANMGTANQLGISLLDGDGTDTGTFRNNIHYEQTYGWRHISAGYGPLAFQQNFATYVYEHNVTVANVRLNNQLFGGTNWDDVLPANVGFTGGTCTKAFGNAALYVLSNASTFHHAASDTDVNGVPLDVGFDYAFVIS